MSKKNSTMKDDYNIDFDKLNENFMSFNMEKIKDNGEDSDPLIIYTNKKVGLFVFDGLGGAGSKKISVGETIKTSAFLASRKVQQLTKLYFDKVFTENIIINHKLIEDYKKYIVENLIKYKEDLKIEKSKIKSDLLKILPTTISGIIISEDKTNENKLTVYNIWAGDSRNYILSSQYGLVQLTTDDLKEQGDAFKNLSSDSKMSNCISADNEFRINHYRHNSIATPVIFFSTTDGAFDYLPTPMHFEYLLLESIVSSSNLKELKQKLNLELSNIVGDDVSMAFAYFGWDNYQTLKQDFVKRLNFIKTAFIEPIDELSQNLEKENEQLENMKKRISEKRLEMNKLKTNLWTKYSLDYNHIINKSNTDL